MPSTDSIHAVIWDMGGVLLRTEDPAPRNSLAQKLGVTVQNLLEIVFMSESSRRAERDDLPIEEHWKYIQRELHLGDMNIDFFREEFFAGDQVDIDLVNYIGSLRSAYKTGLLSNAWISTRAFLFNRYPPFFAAFDAVIFSAEVKLRKPEKQIYTHILEKLDVAPSQAVFIDDYSLNLEGAAALGLHTIHFQSPAQARQELETLLKRV
jgi:epoxide hydrolase-like predicted phosphatase